MASLQVPTEGTVTFKAYADLSTYQYCFVKLSSSMTVTYADANGDLGVGILVNKPTAAGYDADVFTLVGGICPVRAGAAFSYGQLLTADADGEAIAASDNDTVMAIALESAGAADDIVECMIISPRTCSNVSYYYDSTA